MSKSGKATKPVRKSGGGGGGAAYMQQMGFQIPNFDQPGMDDDDDDDDLEAELQRLQQDMGGGRGTKAKKGAAAPDLRAFQNDVNKLLHDIDRPINDDELSDVDEDELLAELNEITEEIDHENTVETTKPAAKSSDNLLSVLQSRQDMYVKAIATAKSNGDASKSRRLERQLKTIQELLQSARSGAPINESDIPPEVFIPSQSGGAPPVRASTPPRQPQQVPVRAPSPPPSRRPSQPAPTQPRVAYPPQPAPPPATSVPKQDNTVVFRTPVSPPQVKPQPQSTTATTNSDPAVERLKALALQAKQRGDMTKAKEYIIQLRTLQGKTPTVNHPPPAATAQRESYDNVSDDDVPPPPLPLKAPEPHSVMEALEQRHDELTKRGEEAASRGDTSKARRMERLSKQYEEAIDATRKGRSFNYSELPDLPGFAPIPVQQQQQPVKPQPTASVPTAKPTPSSNTQGRPSQSQQQRQVALAATTSTRKSQQAQTLRLKQEKFYKLAAKAKQQGDIETAKKFLIAYKGLEQMITAAESGLPIDMSQVPKLPDDDDNDLVTDDDLTQDLLNSDRDTIYRRLQDDLLKQVQLCARNQQIYSQMEETNNLKNINELKALEQRCSKDLEKLRHCFQHGLKPPLFHYERKQMTIIQVNNDLGENDLEVTIIRGINLPIPAGHSSSSSLETYVIIEFPYPTEEPQTVRTRHTAGSTNAEYPEATHKFYIKRNDAKFRRLMNRKELKLTVFYKPGFLRSDRPLGLASIKLATLEQTCTIHESVDLYEPEHKKKIEGKLEVKLRIREALGQTKASDILPQRWLVIDRFEELPSNSKSSSSSSTAKAPAITAIARLVPTGAALGQLAINMAGPKDDNKVVDNSQMTDHQRRRSHQRQSEQAPASSPSLSSVQILNYEASSLQQQIEQLRDRLTPDQLHQLKMKRKGLQEQSDRLVEYLRVGGKQAIQEHIRGLHQLVEYYDQEAREYHHNHETKKADISLVKKKLALKEIDTLSGQTTSTKF